MFTPQAHSELINKKFTVRLLNQSEYRNRNEELGTILKVDSGLFLFRFDSDSKEIWVPLTQITSLEEVITPEAPGNLTVTVTN